MFPESPSQFYTLLQAISVFGRPDSGTQLLYTIFQAALHSIQCGIQEIFRIYGRDPTRLYRKHLRITSPRVTEPPRRTRNFAGNLETLARGGPV